MTTPKTMQAVAIDSYGGKELLKLRELPIPEMSPAEVLIKVEAAGVGVWDAIVRQGFMKDVAPAAFPLVLGGDGSGTISAVGTDVQDFRVGDEVYGYAFLSPKGGFYADDVVLPTDQVALIPKGLTMEQAGALAVPGLTALHGLTDALRLKAGDRLLIFGVGSVGHLAVQLAKRLDIHVLAVASGKDSVALARTAGADEVVDGKGGDLAATIRRFAPEGLDGVLATVNGKGLDTAIAAVRQGGRVAYPYGVQPELKGGPDVEAVGYSGTPDRQTFDQLNALIEAGPFSVHIAQSFPLSEAVQAHAAMEEHHLGRMVLLTAEPGNPAKHFTSTSAETKPTNNMNQEITNLLKAYEKALNTSDTKAAMALYGSDPIFMAQNAVAFIGRDAVHASYQHIFGALKLNVVFSIHEIVEMGDLAYGRTTSAGQQEVLAAHTTSKEANNELFIFRKEQGQWKIHRYLFATSNPPTGN